MTHQIFRSIVVSHNIIKGAVAITVTCHISILFLIFYTYSRASVCIYLSLSLGYCGEKEKCYLWINTHTDGWKDGWTDRQIIR